MSTSKRNEAIEVVNINAELMTLEQEIERLEAQLADAKARRITRAARLAGLIDLLSGYDGAPVTYVLADEAYAVTVDHGMVTVSDLAAIYDATGEEIGEELYAQPLGVAALAERAVDSFARALAGEAPEEEIADEALGAVASVYDGDPDAMLELARIYDAGLARIYDAGQEVTYDNGGIQPRYVLGERVNLALARGKPIAAGAAGYEYVIQGVTRARPPARGYVYRLARNSDDGRDYRYAYAFQAWIAPAAAPPPAYMLDQRISVLGLTSFGTGEGRIVDGWYEASAAHTDGGYWQYRIETDDPAKERENITAREDLIQRFNP